LIYKGNEPEGVSLNDIRESFNLPYKRKEREGEKKDDDKSDENAEKKRAEEEEKAIREQEERDRLDALKAKVDQKRGVSDSKPDKKAGHRKEKPIRKAEKKEDPMTLEQGIDREAKRLQTELSEEDLKPYKESISKAIENLNSDDLRNFIDAHKTYGGKTDDDKDNNFKKWNEDLCDALKIDLKGVEDKDKDGKRMKYAAALQLYLAEHFAKTAKTKGDVFQTTQQNPNPFIKMDGKLGGYTMSVLAAYWNDKYPDKSQGEKKLAYAALDPTYANEQRKNNDIYKKAIAHLEGVLKGNQPLDNIQTTAPQTVVSGAPGSTPTSAPVISNNTAPVAGFSKVAEVQLTPSLQRQVQELVKGATANTLGERGLYGNLQKFYNDQLGNLRELEERKQKDPGTWLLDFDGRKGSWPDRVFSEYKTLYRQLNKSTSERAMDPSVIEKFDALKKVVEDYYTQVESIKGALLAVYRKKAEKIMSDYELPDGIQTTDLEERKSVQIQRTGQYGFMPDVAEIDNGVYVTQRQKIHIDELKKPDVVDRLFKKYFKNGFDAKKVPSSLTADMFSGNTDADKKTNKEAFVRYVGSGDEKLAMAQLKEIIYLRNMYHVNSEYDTMKKHFDFDFNKAIGILDNSYQDYQDSKAKGGTSKFASNVVEKIWKDV
jgi:hypothetical protein